MQKTTNEWYSKNKKHSIAKSTNWRNNNRDRYNESRREKYQEDIEIRREKNRYYYHTVVKQRRAESPDTKAKDRLAALKRIKKLRECIQQTKLDMGGKCNRCSYNEEPRILQFHHINGLKDKLGNISEMKSQRKIREEAKKCELICPNCHAKEHLS